MCAVGSFAFCINWLCPALHSVMLLVGASVCGIRKCMSVMGGGADSVGELVEKRN